MTESERFQADLKRVLSNRVAGPAPVRLRMAVGRVPSTTEHHRPWRWVSRWSIAGSGVAFAAALVCVELLLAPLAAPSTSRDGLRIETEAAPTALPSGAVWGCDLTLSALSLQLKQSGSDLTVVATETGRVVQVVWPYGFTAQLVGGKAELVAGNGLVVAHEGDTLKNVEARVDSSGRYHVMQFNSLCFLPNGTVESMP